MADSPEDNAARVLADRQWPVRIGLTTPIDFGSQRITALEFRRGRLGDLKGLKIDGLPPVDELLLIASRMCSQPIKALELLDDDDATEVLEIALSFFARCLGGGRTR